MAIITTYAASYPGEFRRWTVEVDDVTGHPILVDGQFVVHRYEYLYEGGVYMMRIDDGPYEVIET